MLHQILVYHSRCVNFKTKPMDSFLAETPVSQSKPNQKYENAIQIHLLMDFRLESFVRFDAMKLQ